jgi:hypothetical protein
MRKRLIRGTAAAALAFAMSTATVLAGNPSGTGQPNAECGSQGAEQNPPGFDSGGFANAELNYAGSGWGSSHANSGNAVSQYDVACYQITQH